MYMTSTYHIWFSSPFSLVGRHPSLLRIKHDSVTIADQGFVSKSRPFENKYEFSNLLFLFPDDLGIYMLRQQCLSIKLAWFLKSLFGRELS